VTASAHVRVRLPVHLRELAGVTGEVCVDVDAGGVTARAVLDALEMQFPVLRGTMRDRVTGERRAFVRFFAGEDDVSHDDADATLPAVVASGREPFCVVGAMAGG
jgi:hypothetical protein